MKNFEYKKSLGQNFLIDQNITKKIVNSIDLKEEPLIIEIGPGNGSLTKELVKLDAKVICFEIDIRLKDELDKLKYDNLMIIYEDFLKINLRDFLKSHKYKHLYFIANLPYYITTPIINKIHNESDPFEMVLMVQKEVANRFTAIPGNKSYGSLSVFLQYNYNIKNICLVSQNCFFPSPKVESCVVKFKRNESKLMVNNEEKFYNLIKDSFKFKRKNIRNNLINYNLDKVLSVLKMYNKDLTIRAETLSVKEFVEISNNLY